MQGNIGADGSRPAAAERGVRAGLEERVWKAEAALNAADNARMVARTSVRAVPCCRVEP